MDKDLIIDEICKRVKERLASMQDSSQLASKPKLLVLTETHGSSCHEFLECPVLGAHYQIECALLKEYQCHADAYEAIIAFTMSNEALGKIAAGIFDNDFTRLFGTALLSGKKIYLPQEAVELYQYSKQAPAAYYQRLLANLTLLQDSGVVIAPGKDLPALIIGGTADPRRNCSAKKAFTIIKRVITEKDIAAAHNKRADQVIVLQKAILTDLAKEYAYKQRIRIIREENALAGKEQQL